MQPNLDGSHGPVADGRINRIFLEAVALDGKGAITLRILNRSSQPIYLPKKGYYKIFHEPGWTSCLPSVPLPSVDAQGWFQIAQYSSATYTITLEEVPTLSDVPVLGELFHKPPANWQTLESILIQGLRSQPVPMRPFGTPEPPTFVAFSLFFTKDEKAPIYTPSSH